MKRPISNLDQSIIQQAVDYLKHGELVAFPTETVYGLGADASNENAIKKLYSTKGRPGYHPVIVHLASFEKINGWCEDLPEYAKFLAKSFWPGPLTLIVKKAKHVSNLITGGQDTVGLRIPAHPIALALLEAFNCGIAAPSANKYGRISSTSAEHVRQEFGSEVNMIIDGGNCPIGIESTIVDATSVRPKILRPGILSENDILKCIEHLALADGSAYETNASATNKNMRFPGGEKNHYAPQTPMLLLDKCALERFLQQKNFVCAALTFSQFDHAFKNHIQATFDPQLYARDLYKNLRDLDQCASDYILVENPPDNIEWLAIIDRLQRASNKESK